MYTHMHVYRRYLRKILLHVPQTPIINRASRSHATKVKREGGSGGRGYRRTPGHYAGGSVKNCSKNGSSFYKIWGPFRGPKMA